MGQRKSAAVKMWQLRRHRRIRGYCAEPGCEVKTGKDAYRCEDHAAAYAKRNMIYRLRVAQGLVLAGRARAGAGRY